MTIKKSSDSDSKIHFIGILSRKTTSIRPINSTELGRDCLLLEGVQIPSSSERRPSLEDEDEDIILSTGAAGATRMVTMEIGFESGEEISRWLEVTQDLIN
jgi:hypothetical protein